MWQKISDYLAQLTGIDEVIVGFLYVPLILPFVTGLLMLILLRKDKLSLLAALFTLKPVIAYPIWWRLAILLTVDPPEGMSAPISSFLSILPAILLTAVIVFPFRALFKQEWLSWVWLGGDVLRWTNTFLLFAFPFSTGAMLGFGLMFPSIYALLALVIVSIRYFWLKGQRSQMSQTSSVIEL
jgi:hypothetical protein